MRKVCLPEHITGRLLLHSMPGIKEPWLEFVSQAKEEGLEQILSLTSIEEIRAQSPSYADAIANKTLLIHRIELPIIDFGVPQDTNTFKQCIKTIADSLIKGKIVLIHCLGGIGRTGLATNCILQTLGVDQNEAQKRVKQSGSAAETQEQLDFMKNFIS